MQEGIGRFREDNKVLGRLRDARRYREVQRI